MEKCLDTLESLSTPAPQNFENNSKVQTNEMTELDRLNLKKMIAEGNVEDNTSHIRGLKHSTPIAQDILQIKSLKQSFSDMSSDKFTELCIEKCPFLYNNYTDIFHRVVREELDVKIFSQFLYVLKQVEDDKLNYHEASFTIGKLLKEMYVDSAMRRGAAAATATSDEKVEEHKYVTPKNISWNEYKKNKEATSAATP